MRLRRRDVRDYIGTIRENTHELCKNIHTRFASASWWDSDRTPTDWYRSLLTSHLVKPTASLLLQSTHLISLACGVKAEHIYGDKRLEDYVKKHP